MKLQEVNQDAILLTTLFVHEWPNFCAAFTFDRSQNQS